MNRPEPSGDFTVEDAIAFATVAHRGQIYPSPNGEPYILHPLRVMQQMVTTSQMIVAVLHDVLEDTTATEAELAALGCPGDVQDALDAITRRRDEPYDMYIERVAANELATFVKIADLRDNLENNLRQANVPGNADRIKRYRKALTRLTPED